MSTCAHIGACSWKMLSCVAECCEGAPRVDRIHARSSTVPTMIQQLRCITWSLMRRASYRRCGGYSCVALLPPLCRDPTQTQRETLPRDLRPRPVAGGEEDWVVHCDCGTTDDDGERMVACERCNQWRHTRCLGVLAGLGVSFPLPPQQQRVALGRHG